MFLFPLFIVPKAQHMNAELKLNTNSVAWFIFCSFCAYAYVDVTAVRTCTKHAQALRKLHCCLWNPPLTGLICTKLFISCVERCEPLENTLGQVKKITIITTKQTKKCFSFPPAKFLEVTSLFLLICCWNWEQTNKNQHCLPRKWIQEKGEKHERFQAR